MRRKERRGGGEREERERKRSRRREGKSEVVTERTVLFPSTQFSPQYSALYPTSSMPT